MNSKSQQQSNGCGCLLALITGVLSFMIILPSFLNTVYRPRESEAKQYVGSMNRAQQAYFLENNKFSNDIEKLGLGIKTETENYSYSTRATDKAAFNYGVVHADKYTQLADSHKYTYRTKYIGIIPWRIKEPVWKSYVGGLFLVPATEVNANAAKDEMATLAILCESVIATTTKPAQPTYKNGVLACGEGTKDIRDR